MARRICYGRRTSSSPPSTTLTGNGSEQRWRSMSCTWRPGTGRRVYGIEPYVQLCQGWKRAVPDAAATVDRAIGGEDAVAQSITWTGTHTGPLDGPASTLPASGRQINVVASLWCTFEGGKVMEVHHHLDLLSLLQQIGALTPPASVGLPGPSRGVADQQQEREEEGAALR